MYDYKFNKAIVNNQFDSKLDLSPAIVIIAPTNELANQISQVVKSISSILRFRSISLTSSSKIDNELTRYNLGCDILIATPGRLLSYLQNKQIDISNSKTVVLDEVDVLYMDETYPLQGIGEFIPDLAQYLFITATLPDQTSKQIVREFSTIDRQILVIKGPGLHRIPPTVEEILIDCSIKQSNDITYRRNKWNKKIDSKISNKREDQLDDDIDSDIDNGMESRIDRYIDEDPDTDFESVISKEIGGINRFKGNKADRYIDDKSQQKRYAETVLENKRQALVTALSMNYNIERTIIFCNTIEQCRFVENSLLRVDRHKSSRDIYSYHSAIDRVIRDENLEKFSKKLLVKPVVLICTDRASRGIDFNQINVDHVILFDFPQEPSEYVRRVGRTGRAGRFGKVSILAHGRQIDVITNLLVASKQGKRIEPIPSLNGIQSYSKE